MKLKYFAQLFMCIAIFGCNTNAAKNTTTSTSTPKVNVDSIRHVSLNQLKIANEQDPVCGMPMLRGFEDTTMYEGKLLGFCSKTCKDDFLKKPAGYKIKYSQP